MLDTDLYYDGGVRPDAEEMPEAVLRENAVDEIHAMLEEKAVALAQDALDLRNASLLGNKVEMESLRSLARQMERLAESAAGLRRSILY